MTVDKATGLPQALAKRLADLPHMALAFSGGLDSRFLCHSALLCGCRITAIHVRGPHISRHESRFAQDWAQLRNIDLITLDFDPLPLAEVRTNSRMRCYACKKALFERIKSANPSGVLCDGGNLDDRDDYRPGIRAVEEAGVISPLAEAGLTKAMIRDFAARTNMDWPDQRARPCLLTRYDYGLAPDAGTLRRLAEAENEIAALYEGNPPDFRVRLEPQVVFQCQSDANWKAIKGILQNYGFDKPRLEIRDKIGGYFDLRQA